MPGPREKIRLKRQASIEVQCGQVLSCAAPQWWKQLAVPVGANPLLQWDVSSLRRVAVYLLNSQKACVNTLHVADVLFSLHRVLHPASSHHSTIVRDAEHDEEKIERL